MTDNPQNQPPESNSTNPESAVVPNRVLRFPLRRILIGSLVVVVVGIGGGIVGALIFIQQMLSPLVEKDLTRLLDRPVEIGEVESFSINGLRFGAAALPATATDSDRATIEAVQVAFNPVKLLFNRILELDITLINPDLYVEQDANGVWMATKIKESGEEGLLKVEVGKIRVRNADVVLVPLGNRGNPNDPVAVVVPHGKVTLLEDGKRLRFDVEGQLVNGGDFTLKGEDYRPTESTNVMVSAQDVEVMEAGRLIQLPLILQAGQASGNVELQLRPNQPLGLFGVLKIKDLTTQIAQLPQPFSKSNGLLRFQGTKVGLDRVTGEFGKILGEVNGVLDTEGEFNLAVQTQPVTVKQAWETLKLNKLPVPVVGKVKTDLQVTGPVDQPIVSGKLVNTNVTKVDKVDFDKVSADFRLTTADQKLQVNELQAQPTAGGLVKGKGEVGLGKNSNLVFALQANQIPGDAIASLYDIKLPLPLGPVSGKTQVVVPLANSQNYRAEGSANLNLAGGSVQLSNLQVAGGRWQGLAQLQNLALSQLTPDLPPKFEGRFTGAFNLAGTLASFKPEDITAIGAGNLNVVGGLVSLTNVQLQQGRVSSLVRASGIKLERLAEVPPQWRSPVDGQFNLVADLDDLTLSGISGKGSGRINLAGGRVIANEIQLSRGRWQGVVQATSLDLGRLTPEIPPTLKGPFSGTFQVAGSLEDLSPKTITAIGGGRLNVAGGVIRASNFRLAAGRWRSNVEASRVTLERLVPELPPQIKGPFSGSFQASGNIEEISPKAINAVGGGSLNIAGGTVRLSNLKLAAGNWRTNAAADRVILGSLVPQLPPQFNGLFSGSFQATGEIDRILPDQIKATGGGNLNVAGGVLGFSDLNLVAGNWQTKVAANRVRVGSLVPQLPPQFNGLFTGSFQASGKIDQIAPDTINATGGGNLNLAGATLQASNLNLVAGNWRTNVTANGVSLGSLAPQLPPQFSGPFTGTFLASGNINDISPNTISAAGSGSLKVAGGTLRATQLSLNYGNLQALVEPNGIQLSSFSPDLVGSLGGRVKVSGSIRNPTPVALGQSLRAEGILNFSQGLAVIPGPLATEFRWTGEGIELQQAQAPGLAARGFIGVNVATLTNQPGSLAAINNLDLDVTATDLNLAKLPLPAADFKVVGLADFAGKIAGTPTAPDVNGKLALKDFAIDGLKFDPLLTGTVAAVPGTGVNLQLAGTTREDQIQLALDSNYQPVSFYIQGRQLFAEGSSQEEELLAVAKGTRQGEILSVEAENFPIGFLKEVTPLPAPIASQPLSGKLSGDLAVNLNNFGIEGNVEIAEPIFGTLRGDIFSAKLAYQPNGNIALTDGKFQKENREYLLAGNFIPTTQGPEFAGKLQVVQGELQDVLTALQFFDLPDLNRPGLFPSYDGAADLNIVPVGSPESSLQNQLRRLAEIEQLLKRQRQQREEASPLPEFAQATGSFTGTVNLNASPAAGIQADFDLAGEDWQWGDYSAQTMVAKGEFQNGVLTLLPFRLASGESLASFSGSIGGENQSGQLQLGNLPVAQVRSLLEEFVELPPAVGFGGLINATATLSGSISNPQARGEVRISDATLNQEDVEEVKGGFNYSNARLNFGTTIRLVADAEPLSIEGSIPYQLPVATVAPESKNLSLNIDVENEGLALLNLLVGRQVAWVKGEGTGDVKLSINGIYDQATNQTEALIAQGTAVVNNATIKAQALPEPLTNVTGNVAFNLDRIEVVDLEANYGGGKITALGTIPINQPTPQENPLTVNIGELEINLKGIYSGGVQGGVVVAGTALSPVISGELDLFDGQVKLAEERQPTTTDDATTNSPIQFNNLKLLLARNIQIRQDPLLNFLASGNLILNGSLDQILPQGIIALDRGQVNLFTTQFRLDRRYENTAIFTPNQGFNPDLDIQLVASVQETNRLRRLGSTAAVGSLSTEISDDFLTSDFGSSQTVRIQAKVQGPADELVESLRGTEDQFNESLRLTSDPPRTESEIVVLLGGGFVETLGRGNSTLGLANLAGTALLGNVSNIIGDAVGLSEFRLFPTTITDDEDRASGLGLSAEAGVDLTDKFSVSVLKELTNSEPPQFNLRYRLNDNLRVRAGTDFSEDHRAIIEYERRF
ncbi:MAG: hypothetical protein F6K47_00065 [Symploca sp. SIO2E6]|nr:hypothetical protein [Symploca sp. SIO2E6]